MRMNKFCFLICIFLLFLGPVNWLQAGGTPEDPIEIARGLIIEQRYNEAILLLTDVIREDDERLDDAEDLLRTIRTIRTDYNDLLEELVDVLINEPDNFEKALVLINQMNALDNNRQPEIEEYRRTAQVQYDRTRRNQILEEARVFLEAGQYSEAIDLYVSGYVLQFEPFLERGFAELTLNSVEQVKASFVEIADAFKAINAENIAAKRSEILEFQTLTSALTADPSIASSATLANLTNLSDLMDQINAYNSIVFPVLVNALAETNNLIGIRSRVGQEFPDDPDDEYLKFLNDFFAGPPEFENEGILGAITRSYLEIIETALVELENLRSQELLRMQNAIAANEILVLNEYDLVFYQQQIAKVLRISEISNEIASTNAELVAAGEETTETTYFDVLTQAYSGFYDSTLNYLYTNESIDWLINLSNRKNTFASLELPSVNTLTTWDNQALSVLAELDATDSLEALIENDQVLRVNEFENQDLESSNRYTDDLLVYFRNQNSTNTRNLLEFLTTNYRGALSLVFNPVEQNLNRIDAEFQEVLSLFAGSPDPGNPNFTQRFPREAYELALATRAEIANYIELANQTITRYDLSDQRVINDSRLVAIRDAAQAALVRLQASDTNFAQQENLALADFNESQQLANEAFEVLDESLFEANNERLDLATEILEESQDIFAESLLLQYNTELIATYEQRIANTASEIARIRQLINTRIVQTLKQEARESYLDGDFPVASDKIQEAKDLFDRNIRIEIDEIDPEIEYLINLINAANNLEREFQLLETDPASRSLLNYLSLVQQDLISLQQLVQDGRKGSREYNGLISRIEVNIQNVLLAKPFNFRAKFLQLQLTQIQDPEGFNEEFARQADTAIQRAGEETSGQAEYADLDALYQFNPRYPGLEAAWIALEIKLGLRESPATAANRRQADALYNRAFQVRFSTDEIALEAAIENLDQAIALNPQDGKYGELRSQIYLRLGTQTITLSTSDDILYDQAQLLAAQGNFIEAYAITQRLLLTPSNANFLPLVELDQFLERRI
jgi:hypothetical protein